MKNRLLAALLMFATIPLFTNTTSIQPSFAKDSFSSHAIKNVKQNGKPSNAQLLAHLKKAEIVIKNELQLLSCPDTTLQQKFPDYDVSAKILNGLFDAPEFQEQASHAGKLMVGLLCYKIRPLETFTFRPLKDAWGNGFYDFFTLFPFDDSEEDKHILNKLTAELNIDLNKDFNMNVCNQENLEYMLNLFTTLIEKHCDKDDTRTLQEKMSSIFGAYESMELGYTIYTAKVLTSALHEIENKIRELEQPYSIKQKLVLLKEYLHTSISTIAKKILPATV